MSVLKTIDNVPLFNSQSSAELWGKQYGLSGYHTHVVEEGVYKGQTGFMAGSNHMEAVAAWNSGTVAQVVQAPAATIELTPTPPATTMIGGRSSGGSSGGSGGGGGGY